jgi:hypothetical protein
MYIFKFYLYAMGLVLVQFCNIHHEIVMESSFVSSRSEIFLHTTGLGFRHVNHESSAMDAYL